jgi:hypothetical protein
MRREWTPPLISSPNLLLVEGNHEVALISALAQREPMGGLQCVSIEGKDRLKEVLPVVLTDQAFRRTLQVTGRVSIGVLRDADDGPAQAFQGVRQVLANNQLPAPAKPGEVVEGSVPLPDGSGQGVIRAGVFIVPGGDSPGAIEDLCVASVSDRREFECVERLRTCLVEKNVLRATPATLGKAMAHAYLATQKDPDKHMGNAAQAGYWNLDSDVFDELKQFLHLLAEEVEA